MFEIWIGVDAQIVMDNIKNKSFRYTKLRSSVDSDTESQDITTKDGDATFCLKRNVNVISGITLVVGNVIGSGIFVVPSHVLQMANNNSLGCLFAWFLAGVLTMFTALCLCELATLMPKSGGMLNYLKQIFGDGVCFIACWMLFFTTFPQGTAVQILALG